MKTRSEYWESFSDREVHVGSLLVMWGIVEFILRKPRAHLGGI